MEAKEIVKLQKNVKELAANYPYYDMFSYTPALCSALEMLVDLVTEGEMSFRIMGFGLNENSELASVGMKDNAKVAYSVIATSEGLEYLESMTFKNKKELAISMPSACDSYRRFEGIIMPKMFSYPVLQEFFYLLNVWRSNTGRATIDDDVIDGVLKQVLFELGLYTGPRKM